MQQHFEIIGTGSYLPKTCLTSSDVDQLSNLDSGWTERNIGILKRYQCLSPESLATMAEQACSKALQRAGKAWCNIDLIIDCSTSRHRPIPCNAAHIQSIAGDQANGIPCFDIQSTCLGFIIALNVVNGLFATGSYQNILIVCSEAGLQGANWRQPESAALIGDGAAAVVVAKAENGQMFFKNETYSKFIESCTIDGGAHLMTPFEFNIDNSEKYLFQMDGPTVFRAALEYLPPMVDAIINEAEVARDLLHVVPHQASPKALKLIQRILKLNPDRFRGEMQNHGNLAAAGIPFMLSTCLQSNSLPKNEPVMLLGTSAGYSQAAIIFNL